MTIDLITKRFATSTRLNDPPGLVAHLGKIKHIEKVHATEN